MSEENFVKWFEFYVYKRIQETLGSRIIRMKLCNWRIKS